MKITRCLLLAAMAGLLAGCVSPQIVTPVPAAVDLNQYNTVTVVATDQVNTPFSREALPSFQELLKARLQSCGYSLVDSNAEMVVEVEVREFSLGNRALRTAVGFGAGSAVLKYTARFKDSHGNLLAEMNGGKAYTGMELVDNPTFKSDESTRMGLISYSVSQLGEFLQSNGRTGPPTGPVAHDHIGLAFEFRNGQLIPKGLPQPEAWVYLGKKLVPGRILNMTWVKPIALTSPQNRSQQPSQELGTPAAALALLDMPQVASVPEWSELFEYLNLPLPAMSPQEYLLGFTENFKRHCPAATVTPILVSGTELLLEMKSGGCDKYGDRAEVDRFFFGKANLFHLSYSFKSREMTSAQRDTAIKMLTSWNANRQN
jgi:hypothetical protein